MSTSTRRVCCQSEMRWRLRVPSRRLRLRLRPSQPSLVRLLLFRRTLKKSSGLASTRCHVPYKCPSCGHQVVGAAWSQALHQVE